VAQLPASSGPWTDGDQYEGYVGRWSRLVAREFVPGLGVPPGRRWLDVGCGTGVLTTAVLELAAPASVLGIDRSAAFVAHAAAHVRDDRATFTTGDALDPPVETFDAVVSGLVLNFLADPLAAVTGMRRAAGPGAVVAAYVWDYAGGMQLMWRFWDAAVRVDPAARPLAEAVRFPICSPGPLRELFAGAGLDGVATGSVAVPTVFADFDDYWTPFLGGTGPAPAYVATLDDRERTALREALRRDLPARDDGSIALTARAWTVRGSVPAGG
jgi:SAM-dependent methyltransferase